MCILPSTPRLIPVHKVDLHLDKLVLLEALEDTGDPLAAVRVYRQLAHERVKSEHRLAFDNATKQSGGRGLKARKELNNAEEYLNTSMAGLDVLEKDVDPETLQSETNAAVDLLTDLQSFLAAIGSEHAESKAKKISKGLGFRSDAVDGPCSSLSGG